MSILEKEVSMYRSATDPKKICEVNLYEFLKVPDESLVNRMNQLRSIQDDDKRKAAKSQMPCITVSGTFNDPRSEANLIHHSGLIAVDIDKKQNLHRTDFEYLVREELAGIKCIAYAGRSVTGTGFFCVIPIKFPDHHKEHFLQLEADFRSMGIQIDSACKNIDRLRFYSYDPEGYFNINAATYERLFSPPPPSLPVIRKRSSGAAKNVFKWAIDRTEEKGFRFQDGQKHDFIFNLCCILNYMGISQPEAEDWIHSNLISLSEIHSNCISYPYKQYMSDFGRGCGNQTAGSTGHTSIVKNN